jgi:RND family efflux transporter MFP subunit
MAGVRAQRKTEGILVKNLARAAVLAASLAALVSACSPDKPPAEALRAVRTAEVRYDKSGEANRYVGTVQSRYEVDQGFRVGGKIAERKVDVGQAVREGDVLAVLEDADYRLAEEAARQQLLAATAQARQAESDRKRLEALKTDGSVSAADEEKAQTRAQETRAAAEAEERKLELARNRLKYTVLRAPRTGVVTNVRAQVGQVVAEGQPVVSVAGEGEPEIVVDVPEDYLEAFKTARFTASLASAPDQAFDVVLRELSPQAAAQTRTYRARLKPAAPRRLPLGATATVLVERPAAASAAAPIPAGAITQDKGQPAVWVVRRADSEPMGTVNLTRVAVHGYHNDEVLISGLPAGELVVTAGVQKMAPGLRVAVPGAAPNAAAKQASK